MAEGTITRKDIITDDAINWGAEYAKTMDMAIGKNKIFVDGIIAINNANNQLRSSNTQKEYIENQKKVNDETNKTLVIWKEQIQLENALVSTKNKNALATESTNRKLIEERLLLAQTNKELKAEALNRLGLGSAYEKLNRSRAEAKNKLRDLIASETASTAEINKAQKAFDGYDIKVRKADKAVGDFSKNVGNYKTAFSGISDLFGAFGVVGGVAGFVAVTKDIFNTTKELQSLELALKSVTETQENFAEQQLFLTGISEKYGLEIKNLTKQFTSFYVAAKDKLAGSEIQQIFEDISRSGSALGLSNEELERSFQAVNQMLSKGVVSSEELRGQLAESLPGAVQAMTKAVQVLHPELKNLTERDLFEMIKNGKILANEVLPETAKQLALITGADKAEGMETLTKSTNRLSNAWTEFIRSINNADTSGFSMFVKEIVSGFETILDFASLLFKDEKQLSDYFQNLGKVKGVEEYKAVIKNISTVSKEQQEATKKALLERERETIRVNQAIVKAEKEKRESIMGGDRALFHLQTKQEEDALVQIGKSSAIIKKLKEDALGTTKKIQKPVDEETEKERKAREKAEKEALARAKKLNDDLYNLEKQRLERIIQLNDEIAKDEDETDSVRIAALEQSQKKQEALVNLTKKHQLDADKFLSDQDKLSTNEKIRIKEDAANKIVDIEKKTSEEIDKINEFDLKSYEDNLKEGVTKHEIAMQAELANENERFAALGDLESMEQKDREKAIEEHEKRIFDIKKEFAIATAKLQADNLQAELDAFKAQSDGSEKSNAIILDLEKRLSDARLKLTELGLDNFKKGEKEKTKTAKEQAEEILEISNDMINALSELSGAFSERKIQEIDAEIEKNNEYYDKQLELAGNNERQKELLTQEREKKNAELEKKKRKEQEKQAKYDKAVTIAQIAIQTALAIMKAAPNPFAVAITATLGAIQLAAAIATPIPKYKTGRKGGKAETAWVGDGFVNEVITSADGSNPRLTPNKPTLTHLNKGDIVHKSVDDYNKYVRTSILNGFRNENQRINDFQALQNENKYSKESLAVMKETLSVLKRQKNGTIVNMPKIDINHHLWKMKNTNWNN